LYERLSGKLKKPALPTRRAERLVRKQLSGLDAGRKSELIVRFGQQFPNV
jgi:hypothetical protein